MSGSEWCYAHNPALEDKRARNNRKGGKRGGRGRPTIELKNLEAKLESLADDVLGGIVEPSVAAVIVQIRNAQIRSISTGLKAREQEEILQRLEELEAAHAQRDERILGSWG